MEYVTLGKTGLRVSRVGFGGIPIQRVDAAAARELLDAVRAAGINYIDTARGYTVSEELIGQAIEGCRKDFVLATKSMSRDRDSMARDIGISLGNLRTDYIDLYQVHNPSPEQLEQVCAPGGALEALLSHLGLTEADGAGFSSLGLSGDGMAWRFQRTEDGTVYAVPLDGGEITQEPAAEQAE